MATEQKWLTAESTASPLTTQLDALAASTTDTTGFSAVSSAIDNEAGLYQYIDLELVLSTQGGARGNGPFVAVCIVYSLDGTNYPDDSNKAYMTVLHVWSLDSAATARRLTAGNLPLLPLKFKLQVLNSTGQAFGANSSTLKYRRHNEQQV